MSVLTIKELIDLNETIGGESPEEFFSNPKNILESVRAIKRITDTLEMDSLNAKEIILKKMAEETFVDLASVVENAILTSMISNGIGLDFVRSHANGELRAYTHTVFLSILGALISDEVI